MVVPITNVVKMTLSVADISVEPIIGTPLMYNINPFSILITLELSIQSIPHSMKLLVSQIFDDSLKKCDWQGF